MITNIGKDIIAKYLIGQTSSYASFLAIGCGAKPLTLEQANGNYSEKTSLDFEMFRVPITSRGYVRENNQSKIVFTAELPTEERYEISEIGVYSLGSNPIVGSSGSRTIFSFDESKIWVAGEDQEEIPVVYTPLDAGDLGDEDQLDNVINISYEVFQTNADNRLFTNTERLLRQERCRFLNNIIVMRGDYSELNKTGTSLTPAGGSYIMLTGEQINFNQNAPTDELKLAFSVINKNPSSDYFPDEVRLLIEFSSSATFGQGEWARFELILDEYDFESNRYIVSTKQLQELIKSNTGFNWNSVNTIKIYSSIIKNNNFSQDYYLCLDALRLENKNSSNPLYGLVGYTVLKTSDGISVVKTANKTSYIEFRFALDVGNG